MKTKGRARFRVEHDLIGEKRVPADAYYGVQTLRALENFRISGVPISHYPDFVRALAMVKLAAARANHDCGLFPRRVLVAMEKACREIMDGAPQIGLLAGSGLAAVAFLALAGWLVSRRVRSWAA